MLVTVTVINFVVVFGGVFGFLYIRDKVRAFRAAQEDGETNG